MIWQFPYLNGVVLLSSIISTVIAIIVWRRRPARGAIYLAALMVSVAIWQVGYAFELSSVPLDAMIFWHKVQFSGNVFIPLMWLAFALDYTSKQKWLNVRGAILLGMEPLITLFLIWTNDRHLLFWSGFDQVSMLGYTFLAETTGAWASIHTIYFYLLMLIGSIFIIQTLSYGWLYYRRQTVALMIGVLVPWIANLVDIFTPSPKFLLELTPFALTLSGFAIAWGMYRYRLLDIVPVAREAIIENMTDGMIVLDVQDRIVDLNQSAEKILRNKASSVMGRRIEAIWSAWPDEAAFPQDMLNSGKEIEIETHDDHHIYNLRLSVLFDRHERLTGRMAVLRDVTAQRKIENMLQRRDDILEAISYAAEQFLLEKNWQQVIPDVLARLGSATDVQRVYFDQISTPGQSDETGNSYIWTAENMMPQDDSSLKSPVLLGEQGWIRWREILERGQVIHGPLAELPEMESGELFTNGIHSIVVLPIFVEEKLWGSVGLVDMLTDRYWTPVEIDALRVLSNTIGAAIQREHFEALLQKRALIINTLLKVSEIIGSTLDAGQIMDRIFSAVQQMIPVERVAIFLWDEEKEWLAPLMPSPGSAAPQVISAQQRTQFSSLRLKPADFPFLYELMERKAAIAIEDAVSNPLIPPEVVNYFSIRSLLAVPFLLQDKFIGVLYLDHTSQMHTFTIEELDIANALARQAALALERARLYSQSQEDAEELASLYRASTRLLEAGSDLETLALQITQAVTKEFATAYCSVLLVDEDRQELVMIAQAGLMQLQDIPLPLDGPGITVAAVNHGEAIYIPDVRQDSRYVSAAEYTLSELVFPLFSGGKVMGVLNLESPELDAFNEKDQRIVAAFAENAALALENVHLFNAAQIHARHMMLLNELTRTAIEGSDFQKVLEAMVNHLSELIDADDAYITLYDQESERLIPGAASIGVLENYNSSSFELEDLSVPQLVLQEMRTLVIDDVNDSKYVSPRIAAHFPATSMIALPLVAGEQKFGALMITFSQLHRFTEKEIELCEQAARQVALAISKAWSLDIARRSAQEAETLRQAGAIVAATLNQDRAIQLILEQLERVVPYDSASVQLLRGSYLEIVGGRGWPQGRNVLGTRFPIPGDNPNTLVIEQRQPLIIRDVRNQYMQFRHGPHDHIRSWMGIPLIVRDSVIGMLAVDSEDLNYFTRDHARLATAFADQVAIAMENARLYAAEQQRVMQLDALRATGVDISAELELSRLLKTILERAVSLLDASGGELGLFEEDSQDLIIVVSHNLGQDYAGTRLAMGEGGMGTVAVNLEPLIINDYISWEGRLPLYAAENWHSVMASPLMVHGRLVGVISVVDEDPTRLFSPADLELLNMFATQSAIAVDNAHLYKEAIESTERRAVLHNVSQEIVSASLEPEQIYATIHKAAGQLMPAEAFVITLVDRAYGDIHAVYLVDRFVRTPSQRIPLTQGLSGQVLSTGKSVYIEDYEQLDEKFGIHFGTEEYIRSVLAVPLRLGEEIIGMISVQSYQSNAYTAEDMLLLEMLASHAAIALENARLFAEVQLLAITDPLTDLYNRRGLAELGRREIDRSRRFGRPLSAIMLDIDNFKSVNDTFGHSIGDQVLVGLADVCRSLLREVDLLVRYGGEEFLILLPEADLSSTIQVAERLRRRIGRTSFHTDPGEIHITISLGVVAFRNETDDLEILINRADEALYAAKQAGRDQVVTDQKLIAK
jgi:diguanylate cyclase (GGDEF)-like protein/PAS domain S-box-containing protein